MPVELQPIIDALWHPQADGAMPNVYAVLDCARDKRIEPLVNNSQLPHECLYAGKLTYVLKRAAPHIVKLNPHAELTHTLIREGWGNSWGIFYITSPSVSLALVRNACRRIAKVQSPEGKTMVFRYYDPRVLRVLLPACDEQELRAIFGPADQIIMDNQQQLLRFTLTELIALQHAQKTQGSH